MTNNIVINPSGGGVPYTGATQDLDMGTHSLSAVGLNFPGGYSLSPSGSALWWTDGFDGHYLAYQDQIPDVSGFQGQLESLQGGVDFAAGWVANYGSYVAFTGGQTSVSVFPNDSGYLTSIYGLEGQLSGDSINYTGCGGGDVDWVCSQLSGTRTTTLKDIADTSVAADGTYSFPTSITISKGLITAIS